MYEQVGDFDALVSTAGEAHFGPFETATEEDLALGVHSKLLGQIRLRGRTLISEGASFTLISGYIFDDPILEGGQLRRRERRRGRLRAGRRPHPRRRGPDQPVSPGMAQDSSERFGPFNPGRTPYRCPRSPPATGDVWSG
jgi:hypothetical protein